MKILKVKLDKLEPAAIKFTAGSLRQGQVAVLPTDTIYGLSCRADDADALKKIYRLKKRDKNKPFLILVSDLKMLKRYTVCSPSQVRKLKNIWLESSRPTTVILKNKSKLPKELISASRGLAVRLPKSVFLIKIIKELACPLISTSVNLSGQSALTKITEIIEYFKDKKYQPELIVSAGKSQRKKISRVIDLRDLKELKILRK